METLIIKVDTSKNASQVAALLKKTKGVQSVVKESKKYNWAFPTRAATNEEIEEMISECEDAPLLSVKEAKEITYSTLSKWKKQKK